MKALFRALLGGGPVPVTKPRKWLVSVYRAPEPAPAVAL